MCRHVGYLGPPVRLGELLLDPPHSLVTQSYAPQEMRGGGRINADGFGIGWFPLDGGPAARYRRSTPLWSDDNLPGFAGRERSGAVLGSVRNATVGMPVSEYACAPFTDGAWLFSLNGFISGWPSTVAELGATLPVTVLMTMEAATDSVLIWALVRQRLEAGEPPHEAVRSVALEVEGAAPGSRLNLLLVGPALLVATTLHHALSYRSTGDSVVVCSEPLDAQPGWVPVSDRRLVVATAHDIHITPLEGRRP